MGFTDSDSDTGRWLRLDDEETPLELVVIGLVAAVVFLVAFGLLAAGWPWFWIAFPVGFGGLLPAAIGAVRLYEQRRSGDPPTDYPTDAEPRGERDDALATLRERFARGDIDDETFERQVAALLETGTLDDAEAYLIRDRGTELNR